MLVEGWLLYLNKNRVEYVLFGMIKTRIFILGVRFRTVLRLIGHCLAPPRGMSTLPAKEDTNVRPQRADFSWFYLRSFPPPNHHSCSNYPFCFVSISSTKSIYPLSLSWHHKSIHWHHSY